MATIADVAARAGVSGSTVSHTLNCTRFVAPALQARVLAAVSELGYRHNALARSLRTGKSELLALVIPDLTNPYYPEVARGVQDAADDRGYAVVIYSSDRRLDREQRFLLKADERQFDGVVFDPADASPQILSTLAQLRLPMVLVGSRIDSPAYDRVLVGPRGAYEPVRHLLAAGHRRIGLIGGPPSVHGRPAKATGYIAALGDAGIAPDPAMMVDADYTREGGARAMQVLLGRTSASGGHLTAVFAANDLMAIGALDVLHAAGIRVPEEMAVAGYDDIPQAAFTSPPLTTVAVPKYEIGRRAVGLLLERMQDPDLPPRRVELANQLIVRASA